MKKIRNFVENKPIWLVVLFLFIMWTMINMILFTFVDLLLSDNIKWLFILYLAMILSAILPTLLYSNLEIQRRKSVWYYNEKNEIKKLFDQISKYTSKINLQYLQKRIDLLVYNKKSNFIKYDNDLDKMTATILNLLEK